LLLRSDTPAWWQGGEWCLPKVGAGGLSIGDGPPKKEDLDAMCDPCTLKYYTIFMRIFMLMMEGMPEEGGSSSGGSDMNGAISAMLKAMCTTDKDGSYCMLQPAFQSMMGEGQGDKGPAASAMCSHCGKKVMQASAKAGPKAMADRVSKEMVAGCFKKGDKFCADYISEGPPTWDTVVKDCGAPGDPSDLTSIPDSATCSSTCNTTVMSMVSNWGCCMTTMAKAQDPKFTKYVKSLVETCGGTPPRICAGGKPLRIRIKVKNLKKEYYDTTDGSKMVTDLVGTDLSDSLGVVKDMVSTTGEAMQGGGTRLGINMEFSDQGDSDAVKAAFKAAYARRAAVKLSFDSLELLPADAKVDPEASMAVEVEPEIEDGESKMFDAGEAPAPNSTVLGSAAGPLKTASTTALLAALLLSMLSPRLL